MRFLIYITLLVFIAACSPQDKKAATKEPTSTDSLTGKFVANPQPVVEQEVKTLEIGDLAPDFTLPSTDGKTYSLDDFQDKDVLVVVFTCNHCPTAQAYEDRFIKVASDYKDQSVAFVAISPNSPLGLLYEELGYSDLNDDFEEMEIRVRDKGYNFPYLYDGDDQAVSLKYGPVATPHIFLFNKDRQLAYRGRFDSTEKPGTANAEDLRGALDAVLAGKSAPNPTTKTFGCSTKWGWKLKMKSKADKEWASREVQLKMADRDGIQDILKRRPST